MKKLLSYICYFCLVITMLLFISPVLAKENNVILENVLSIETSELIYNMIKQGLGVGYILYDMVKNDIDKGILKEIKVKEHLPEVPLNLIYREKNLTEAPLKFINEFLEK